MTYSTSWQASTFGQLRNLVIERQTFRITTCEAFFGLLTSNLWLENIIFRDVFGADEDEEAIKEYCRSQPCIRMPNLKRTRFSRRHDSPAAANLDLSLFFHSKVAPGADGWARRSDVGPLLHLEGLSEYFPSHDQLPIRTLGLGATCIGTDGRSAICISAPLDLLPIMMEDLNLEVRELWLGTYTNAIALWMRSMDQVDTLVIPLSSEVLVEWLDQILFYGLFPALQELRVVVDVMAHYLSIDYEILEFLRYKEERCGRKLSILRVLHAPMYCTQPTSDRAVFTRWQARSSEFAPFVDSLSFDRDVEQTSFIYVLPDVCTSPSPLLGYWDS